MRFLSRFDVFQAPLHALAEGPRARLFWLVLLPASIALPVWAPPAVAEEAPSPPLVTEAVKARVYSVQELVGLARERNHSVRRSGYSLLAATTGKQIAWKNAFLPSLSASVGIADSDIYNGPLTDAELEALSAPVYSAQLGVSYALFNGFKDYYSWKAGAAREESAELSFQDERAAAAYDVRLAHLDYSLAARRLAILREDLERAAELRRIAEVRYRRGLIPESELDRVRIRYIDAEKALLVQRDRLTEALSDLKNLVAIEEDFEVLAAKLEDLPAPTTKFVAAIREKGPEQASAGFYESYLERYRPLRVLELTRDLQLFDKRINQGDYLPKLIFDAQYDVGRQARRAPFEALDAFRVSLTLSLPIFDSFDTYLLDIRNAHRVQESEMAVEENRFSTRRELERLSRELLRSHERLEKAREQLRMWRGIYRVALERFRSGATDIRDLLEDKAALNESGQEVAALAAEVLRTELSIHRLTGEEP